MEFTADNLLEMSLPPETTGGQRALQQDEFGEAFAQGYPMTLRFLLSRGASSDTAEEIAQAAWAKGWECRGQLLRPDTVRAWVNSIAKNMLKNQIRSQRKLERLTESSDRGHAPVMSIDMKSILNRCDQRDSKILRGYYVEGYTTEEIANQVGLAPVTVRVRLLRTRRALRSQLNVHLPPASASSAPVQRVA